MGDAPQKQRGGLLGSPLVRLSRLPLRLISWLSRKLIWLLAVLALVIATNVITLTVSSVNAFLSDMIASLGTGTVSHRRKASLAASRAEASRMKERTSRMASSVRARTARVVSVNMGGLAAEALPFFGVAAVVGVTAYDLKSACDTMKDIDALEQEILGPRAADDATTRVCGIPTPTADDLWATVSASPARAWEEAARRIADADISLPRPDFGGWYGWLGR